MVVIDFNLQPRSLCRVPGGGFLVEVVVSGQTTEDGRTSDMKR
jgi:hypothetical protein